MSLISRLVHRGKSKPSKPAETVVCLSHSDLYLLEYRNNAPARWTLRAMISLLALGSTTLVLTPVFGIHVHLLVMLGWTAFTAAILYIVGKGGRIAFARKPQSTDETQIRDLASALSVCQAQLGQALSDSRRLGIPIKLVSGYTVKPGWSAPHGSISCFAIRPAIPGIESAK